MNAIITNNLEAIQALCKKHHVKELYAFGSVLRDDFSENSDVDLLADFSLQPNNPDILQLKAYFENFDFFRETMEYTLKRPVDLFEERNINNEYLRYSINTEKQLVYAEKE